METEVEKLNQLKLRYFAPVKFFIEKEFLCIVEKFLPLQLDTLVNDASDEKEIYLIALEIAKGI